MKTVHSIAEIQNYVTSVKADGKTVAFVPTMGNLHEGHLMLIKKAKTLADIVVASIYVNPLQFGPNEDLDAYPKTMEQDCAKLIAHNVDALYAAKSEEIYPEGSENHTHVSVGVLEKLHCGNTRPGFFRGIATVVTKLFHIVRPDIAVFGEKDYQQLAVIRKIVKDLCIPVQIIGVPTVRENSALAMSSRNGYLSEQELHSTAPTLYKTLMLAKASIQAGERDYGKISRRALAMMEESGIKPDYFNVCNTQTLLPAGPDENELIILAAGYLSKARLIDNIYFSISP